MDRLLSLLDRVEGLPEWLRPVLYGPLFVAVFMTAKGVLVLGPVVAALALSQSDDPMRTFATGCLILAIVFSSSAAGGLAYSVIGRPISRILPFGWIIAGWAATSPYFLGLMFVIRMTDGIPMGDPLRTADWGAVGIMTAIFGTQIGYMVLRPGAMD